MVCICTECDYSCSSSSYLFKHYCSRHFDVVRSRSAIILPLLPVYSVSFLHHLRFSILSGFSPTSIGRFYIRPFPATASCFVALFASVSTYRRTNFDNHIVCFTQWANLSPFFVEAASQFIKPGVGDGIVTFVDISPEFPLTLRFRVRQQCTQKANYTQGFVTGSFSTDRGARPALPALAN